MSTLPPRLAADVAAVDAKERWARARALFDVLLELRGDQRAQAIADACGADPPLASLVESLMRSHDVLDATVEDRISLGIGHALHDIWPEARRGQRFGAFAIVEEIGRGGMGVVYLAERCDGAVTQRVALKIVTHAGLDTAASHRLGVERRLLATLEHPNIARLIDAGEDASGIPYFAMEYVQGLPITTYCDKHALPLMQRLQLFRQVCSAVQYAHTRLIVHCDLKSGNILVTESGLPKLLDFGIATTLDLSRGDAQSAAADVLFLSPQIAAPEQFLGLPRSVATDVYALGVLLCELTAGARPFESSATAAARISQLGHDQPWLPSQAATEAAARLRGGLRLPALRRKLRGDIDAIAAQALCANPQQRYASVDHLDADLLRHLESRPVHVRRGERGYRLARFLRRNALPVLLSAALATLLAAFTMSTIVQNRRLATERDLAQAHAREAQFEQTRAQQVTDFMIGLFQSATPEQARGHEPDARELLARGRQQLEARPQLQADLRAALLAAISDAHLALDDLEGAEKTAREAAQLRDQTQPVVATQQAASLRQLAHIANQRGHPAEALALVQRARSLGVATGAGDRAALLAVEAAAMEGLGRPKEAVALWRDVLAAETGAYGEDDVRTLRTAMRLAHALRTLGLADEAERILQENLPREQRSFATNDPALGETLQDLAIFARNRGELAKAQRLAIQALDIYRAVYGNTASQTATAMNTLATIAQANQDFAQARSLFEQALATKRAVFGNESAQVASAQYNLGLLLLLRLRVPAQAAVHLQEASDIGGRVLPAGHTNLANYHLALGSSLRELGRLDEAESVLRQALLAFQANRAPQGVDVALTHGELACVALARAASPESEHDLDAALALLDRQAQDDPQALRLHECRNRF